MRRADSIDFSKYAEALGAETIRLRSMFQLALDVTAVVRSKENMPFDQTAKQICRYYGIQLWTGSTLPEGSTFLSNHTAAFLTIDRNRNPVIAVASLESNLEGRVSFYHALGHALLHIESLRNYLPGFRDEELIQEAEAEIFAIVVAIHDPTVTSTAMLDYLTDLSQRDLGSKRRAFETGIAFFKENWMLLVPDDTASKYGAPLVLSVSEILVEQVSADPGLLHSISPYNFEGLMTRVFSDLGYLVEQTKRTRDGGIDIVAVKSVDDVSLRFLIECKRYAAEKRVGVSLVRELFGVKHHLGASKAIIATTSDFTKPATEFAEAHKWELELKNREGIIQWIKSALISRQVH